MLSQFNLEVKYVAVFCGSRLGKDTAFADAATALGASLAEHQLALIYGGGDAGLMGKVAKAALDGGSKVVEVLLPNLKNLRNSYKGVKSITVPTLQERKSIMLEKADAFIVLPGSFGTLDELTEVAASKQMGILNKPIAILNTNNYYQHFLEHIQVMIAAGFVYKGFEDMLSVETNPSELVAKLVQQ